MSVAMSLLQSPRCSLSLFLTATYLLLPIPFVFGEDVKPTNLRVWKSKAGTVLVARAVEVRGTHVKFVTREGKEKSIALELLEVKDQLRLKDHFPPEDFEVEAAEVVGGGGAGKRSWPNGGGALDLPMGDGVEIREPKVHFGPVPEELGAGVGVVFGPVKAAYETSYYFYAPPTIPEGRDGREAAVVFWTGHHEGKAETLNFLIEGANLCGVALATSVEARHTGRFDLEENLEHTKECIQHMQTNMPVNVKRIIFSGNDRGAASALYNSDRFRCAGTITINGYLPRETFANARGYFFVASGTQNINRYRAANAVAEIGKYATFYPYPGNVSFPDEERGTYAMVWVYARHLYSENRLRHVEARAFEARMKRYLVDLAAIRPWKAYQYTDFFLRVCDVEGDFRAFNLALQQKTRSHPDAVPFFNGWNDIQQFGRKIYAGYGLNDQSLRNHTSPEIEYEVAKMLEQYAQTPEVSEILQKLAFPTN